MVVEPVELDERDRSENVGEVGLEARSRLVVARAVATACEAHRADPVGDVVTVGGDQAALASSDVLGRVEREARRVGDCADLSAAIHALERVSGILDDGNAEREQRVEVARLPGQVDRQDRLRPLRDETRRRARCRC